jgi:hypothetical protein
MADQKRSSLYFKFLSHRKVTGIAALAVLCLACYQNCAKANFSSSSPLAQASLDDDSINMVVTGPGLPVNGVATFTANPGVTYDFLVTGTDAAVTAGLNDAASSLSKVSGSCTGVNLYQPFTLDLTRAGTPLAFGGNNFSYTPELADSLGGCVWKACVVDQSGNQACVQITANAVAMTTTTTTMQVTTTTLATSTTTLPTTTTSTSTTTTLKSTTTTTTSSTSTTVKATTTTTTMKPTTTTQPPPTTLPPPPVTTTTMKPTTTTTTSTTTTTMKPTFPGALMGWYGTSAYFCANLSCSLKVPDIGDAAIQIVNCGAGQLAYRFGIDGTWTLATPATFGIGPVISPIGMTTLPSLIQNTCASIF